MAPHMSRDSFEVIIVGGGIAGASLAYFLSQSGLADVLVVEREEQPAYHATGRSAAALVEHNGRPLVRRLITRGAAFLRQPPAGFADEPLLDPVGVVVPADSAGWADAQAFAATAAAEGIRAELLTAEDVLIVVPDLDPRHVAGGLLFPDNGHLDVHALLSAYLRHLTRAGGEVRCGVEVTGMLVEGGRCVGVETNTGRLRARWVVDAAGAWAGVVAALAGATPITFTPRRRTIITFAAPSGRDVSRWPMVDCEARRLYFKPESGGFLASPMDETPVPPGDAAPAEEDVAQAVERLATYAPALAPRALRRKWAGLRTFAPDEVPVIGEDPRRPGFFWLAGQGGVGIETSPVLGRIAADLLTTGRSDVPEAAALSPARFAK